jgi:hypothetical protein
MVLILIIQKHWNPKFNTSWIDSFSSPHVPPVTQGCQTLAIAAVPSPLLSLPRHRRRAPPRHNPNEPLGWRWQGVSLLMAVAQWSPFAGRVGVTQSMGLAVTVGRSVPPPPPPRPSCSVDGGHLLGASVAVGGRSTVVVAGGRSSRLR